MSGYLMLAGEDGLVVLEKHKFKRAIALSETYHALQAVRFMWQHGDGKIPDNRLLQSVRTLLDHPELADLIVAELARMEDWSSLDRIAGLYDRSTGIDETLVQAARRAIVRYLAISSRAVEFDFNDEKKLTAEISKRAKTHLDAIRKRDPKTVERAFRFLPVKK